MRGEAVDYEPRYGQAEGGASATATLLRTSLSLEVGDLVMNTRTGEVMRVGKAWGRFPRTVVVERGVGMGQPSLPRWRRWLGFRPPEKRGLPIAKGDEVLYVGRVDRVA